MRNIRPIFFCAMCAANFFGGAPAAFSQRAFNLRIAPTNNTGVAVSWPCQSATPLGDLIILPQFVVQRSDDLQSWTSVSSNSTASLGQKLTFTDTSGARGFYRVQSIINQEYAEIPGAVLDFGDLTGADFFGANLFGASLQQTALTGSKFAAADLRNADFTQADLRGADLFAAFATQADFESGTLAGADCSFGIFEAASFFDVDLTGVDFSSATLDTADFDFAIWNGVKMDANTIIDPKPKLIWQIVNNGATNAVLTNADLSFATLV